MLPKLVATREQLQHSLVRAPATGQVVGLTVFTVGGVVAPGQKLMDIVPDGRELVIQAQLAPSDADDAYPGQKAQMRFVSVHNRTLPLFTGRVRTVSADSFTDEKTGRSFFRAEIVVPEKELAKVRSVARQRRASPGPAGRRGADRAQAHRASISARAADRRPLARRPRGLKSGDIDLPSVCTTSRGEMVEQAPPKSGLKRLRILLWLLVAVALAGAAALFLLPRAQTSTGAAPTAARCKLRRVVHADRRRRQTLLEPGAGGQTLCHLFRLHPLRRRLPDDAFAAGQAAAAGGNDDAMRIVFVTIDPANDGPKEVGQYAELFGAPIIGLTGSQAQIDQVKKQYGIYAQPVPHAAMGKQMEHTATVLLFDSDRQFAATITPDEPDSAALEKIKALVG